MEIDFPLFSRDENGVGWFFGRIHKLRQAKIELLDTLPYPTAEVICEWSLFSPSRPVSMGISLHLHVWFIATRSGAFSPLNW